MNYIWESIAILFTGVFLLRIAGKKATAEMTALELITVLTIASVIGHAIPEYNLLKTILSLCSLVAIFILIQLLTIKFNFIQKLFIGTATPVIQDGNIVSNNLKKLRMFVEQLDAKLRENGISSITDVKNASIEMTGKLGYELMKHARPVTVRELERMLNQLQLNTHQHPTLDENGETK
ncbi:hypothetical protein BABA_02372 [Neobacillus bataviensis LMG 21833]|uniref:YetF C-terminal domain-containing protein n=1 Tax=Neobacillus bataviensis LMG 21833 TaxID=1117379 RepID=K6DFF6_9BACI|nr:YetF domain-containing protein [Neobacillus bataviensis]EKN71287.1 hypothetical protein BABA_02372 [Neobacillus bataviensis LMG 21833]